MKFKKSMLFIALATASASVMASGFDGPFVQGGLGFSEMRGKAQDQFPGDPDGHERMTKTNVLGQIAAGYSQSFGRFNLAGTVYTVLGDQKAGSRTDVFGFPGVDMDFKGRNTVGFTIEPGVNINPNSLVYAKLGFTQMRGRGTVSFPGGSDSEKRTHNGFSYGAGFKYKFTPNIYGMVEIMQTNFNRKVYSDEFMIGGTLSAKPRTLTGIVGIGYTF